MAVAITNLVEAQSTADGSGQSITGVTLDAGKAYLLTIAAFNSTSLQPLPQVFSHGSWELIGSIDFDTVPVNLGSLFVYKHVDEAVASHTLTITFYDTVHSFCASIDAVTGCDLTDPFPQWVGREDNVTPETTGTLGTMVDSSSRSFVALAKNSAVASIYTMDTDWTLLTEGSVSSPTLHLTTCWSDADGAATSASFVQSTGSATAGNIILEIANDSGASVTVTPTPGAFSFAGAAPLVSTTGANASVGPLPGAFSFAGAAPAVSTTTDVTVDADRDIGELGFGEGFFGDELVGGTDLAASPATFSFSAPVPTIEGTLSEDDGDPSGGPSLRRRFSFWDYKHVGTEKSLKDR